MGSHDDDLWGRGDGKLYRAPEVTRIYPAGFSATVQVGSPFGGLLYIRVGEGLDGGVQAVVFSGAVRAPWFVRGRDTNAGWASAK